MAECPVCRNAVDEAAAKAVAVRRRDTGDAGSKPVADLIAYLRQLIDTRAAKW